MSKIFDNKHRKHNLFKKIYLWFKRAVANVGLSKLVLILVFTISYLNKSSILKTIQSFGINEYQLIRQYIETMISWPLVVLIVSLHVLNKFSSSIKTFLENVTAFKAGPVEMSRQDRSPEQPITKEEVKDELRDKGTTLTNEQIQQIEDEFGKIVKEKQNIEQEVGSQKELINYLATRSELFEFAYLNLYLVPNTKNALLWFNSQPSSTHQNFIYNFQLPPLLPNPEGEKEAVLNALLTNQLLENETSLLKINEKGRRFLKFIRYIN